MKKKKTIDLIILLIYPVIASALSFLLNVNSFISVVLFLVVPSLYLSLRLKTHIKKSLIFSAIISVPAIIITDYIANITQQWLIPNSILPFRLFGIVTIEIIAWSFFSIYFIIMFYEYFLDEHTAKKLWHPNMKYLISFILLVVIIFLILFFNFPSKLNINYFYLSFGVVLILIPVLIELFSYPNLAAKFFKAGAYFFLLTSIYEITALKLGWWEFPGKEFIGWVSILGVQFPIEEFFFWLMLFAMAFLSYYEFFYDNQK